MKDAEGHRADRDRIIMRASGIGIITNVLLSLFKAAVGLAVNSIAVILDAVNNFTDALSSVITIAGVRMAGRIPDREHPLGHGRAEYISAMVVSAIVFYAGITAAFESVKKIIHPEEPDYSTVSLIIISVAVAVKLALGFYVKKQGAKADSMALTASGKDALYDAVISASVLASALIFITAGVSLEAYVGLVISFAIIKSAVDMIKDTIDDIIGRRADPDLSRKIKNILVREPGVEGAYDLMIDNYGPGKNYASVHLELPDGMTVGEVDKLTRKVQRDVYKMTGVILTAVGVYSYNTSGSEAAVIRNRVMETVMSHEWAIQVHGFYVDLNEKDIRFDVVMSFDVDQKEAREQIYDEVKEMYPDYKVFVVSDVDISD